MPTMKQVGEFVDQIALIDLDNGMQITTRITKVEDDQIHTEECILFQLVPNPQNPQQPQLNGQPLGGPFRDKEKPSTPIDLSRVVFIHTPIDAIAKAYMQATTGIEIAGANQMPRGEARQGIIGG